MVHKPVTIKYHRNHHEETAQLTLVKSIRFISIQVLDLRSVPRNYINVDIRNGQHMA